MKKSAISFILMIVSVCQIYAQTPQYYNINDGTISNFFPFSVLGGKAVNTIFQPGDFDHPAPLPSGKQISKIYFRISIGGTRNFTDLKIMLAQSSNNFLTRGAFYTGPYDTVYKKSSVELTAVSGDWLCFTLDHPYTYDVSKSLIMLVGQCGSTGTGISIYNKDLSVTGVRRVWSIGGCPFAVNSVAGDSSVVNLGLDMETVLSSNTKSEVVKDYSLCQNYPNPFNPVTEIEYSLPEQGFVTLKIFDLLGKEIATLVNEVKKAGKYSATFNGENLSSGMYYYKLESNGYSNTKKMMLIK